LPASEILFSFGCDAPFRVQFTAQQYAEVGFGIALQKKDMDFIIGVIFRSIHNIFPLHIHPDL